MKSNPRSVYDLFDGKRRYVVPLYQRQYVWDKEDQWEPLSEDILNKTMARLEGNEPSPHFLGAMVLDQMKTFGNQIPAHTVIDGQQRLTTLQVFLAAFRNLAHQFGYEDYAKDVEPHIKNSGLMENQQIEQFKVFPTKADQQQFRDVISATSAEDLEKKYPPVYVKRKLQKRQEKMVDAYLYFTQVLLDFFQDQDIKADLSKRIAALHQALLKQICRLFQ